MLELPDRRAIFILAPPITIGLVSTFVSPASAFANPLEVLLYATVVCAGLAFAVLDLREGYCLNRPSVTRDESPFFFWLEFLASCCIASVGAYKLAHLI